MLIDVATVVAGEPLTGVTVDETGREGVAAVSEGLVGLSVVAGCRSVQVELATPVLSVLTANSSPCPLVAFSVKPSEKKPPSLAAAEAAKYSLSGLPVDLLVW